MFEATASAPVNIATLKYWGKRDVNLNLPTNSSISVTLAQDDLRATTTARASSEFAKDELYLNDTLEPLGKRTLQVLAELRALRAEIEQKDPSAPKIADLKLQIVSVNNFPTAAGLASSAAGFAALVKSISLLYKLPHNDSELSVLARQGSGSACRSMFGGYVAWEMGSETNGLDSRAVQIADVNHWPNMKALILVVCAEKKDVSSTSGMQITVETSGLFTERVNTLVPELFVKMKKAILDRDFGSFAKYTMVDSNQFHAVCLDSYPPIFYMNDVSKSAVRAIHELNDQYKEPIAAYTFDAGPNCVVYYLEENEEAVLSHLGQAVSNVNGFPVEKMGSTPASTSTPKWADVLKTGIERVISTRVGPGPQPLTTSLSKK
ncbi:diphosphomevalonate decarboxylase [Starmerella bacillaris]|uniref:Diphosphomevalonate decarboxylase n=1 Tax=Starmerella bacillaris TaxID=1247836 RepID=A0AAV5RCI5_STABA|nr:diphosphomevalonate decarboxylase [Starmerella bacillaris]